MPPCIAAAALLGASAAIAAGRTEPTGCPPFEVEAPRPHGGAIVRAADFGFSAANTDNAAALNRALAECRRIGAERLELAPGTYRCHGPDGVVLREMQDFTLDGRGALLVFYRKHPKDWDAAAGDAPVGDSSNLVLDRCRRVCVRDVRLDWDWSVDPLGFFGTCAGVHVDEERDDASYVDFDLPGNGRHPRWPEPVPVQTVQPMDEAGAGPRLDGGARCWFGQQPGHFGSKNEWLSPTRLRVWPCVAQPDRPERPQDAWRFSPAANRRDARRFEPGRTYVVSHRYYGCGGIYLTGGEHVTLRDVEIWSCPGTGVCLDGTLHHVLLERLRIAPPDPARLREAGTGGPERRCLSSTSDAIHVARSGGFLRLDGCELAFHNDDSLNVHDCTALATADGPRRLRFVCGDAAYLGARAGDEIELRQENFSRTGWTGRIAAIAADGALALDGDLPPQAGRWFLVADRAYATGRVHVKDCRIHDVPWGRSVVHAPDATIEGCTFERLANTPLRLQVCVTTNAWCEGVACTNVVVRGNVFRDCSALARVDGVSPVVYCGLRAPPGVRPAAASGVLGDILVESNRFERTGGVPLHADVPGAVLFRDNRGATGRDRRL